MGLLKRVTYYILTYNTRGVVPCFILRFIVKYRKSLCSCEVVLLVCLLNRLTYYILT